MTESRLPHCWQPSQKAGDVGVMLLDSHAGGEQGAGTEGEQGVGRSGNGTHPGDGHKDMVGDGCSKYGFVGLLSSSKHFSCSSGFICY